MELEKTTYIGIWSFLVVSGVVLGRWFGGGLGNDKASSSWFVGSQAIGLSFFGLIIPKFPFSSNITYPTSTSHFENGHFTLAHTIKSLRIGHALYNSSFGFGVQCFGVRETQALNSRTLQVQALQLQFWCTGEPLQNQVCLGTSILQLNFHVIF